MDCCRGAEAEAIPDAILMRRGYGFADGRMEDTWPEVKKRMETIEDEIAN